MWKLIDAEIIQTNYSQEQITARLQKLPPGYLLLYAFVSTDGQVCNGGFEQLHQNRYAILLDYAAPFADLIQRPELAAVLLAAKDLTQDLNALNDEYFSLRRIPDRDQLRKDQWLFPTTHPRMF